MSPSSPGRRVHLAVSTKDGAIRRVACGQDPQQVRTTTRPERVTCKGCQTTLDLADAEMRDRLRSRRAR